MIRLEIDGMPVSLGEEASFDFYSYNPMLDGDASRGEYTYDIEIDLRSPQNARLYRHINRLNTEVGITGRRASLTTDGIIFVEGKEVLLECNDKVAKIQIVSDTHVKEHVFDESRRLSELNLGSLPQYTPETALATLNAEPLSVPAVCTPVLLKVVTNNYNSYSFCHMWSNFYQSTFSPRDMLNFASIADLWSASGSWEDSTRWPTQHFIGQPYLVIVVERVLEALGWTIKYNALRQMEFARRMIVIHGYETRDINKMVPDWTVAEFMEQIQKMFNVVFYTNDRSKNVSILPFGTFYENMAPRVTIPKKDVVRIESHPSRKFEELDNILLDYKGLKYALPKEDYGNRGDIAEEVRKHTSLIELQSLHDISIRYSPYRSSDYYNKPYFFHDQNTGTKWMLAKGSDGMAFNHRFVRVDQFARAKDEGAKDDEITELKIVPVETLVITIHYVEDDNNHTVRFAGGVVVPYTRSVGNLEPSYETSADSGLNEWVAGSLPEKLDTQSENLYVAQYLGRTLPLYNSALDNYPGYRSAKYPQVFTHRYIDGYVNYGFNLGLYTNDWDLETNWTQQAFDALRNNPELEEGITFDLQKRWNEVYKKSLLFDNTETHTISFRNIGKLDVNSIFNIAGREYACVSLLYRVARGKLQPYITGTFLPLH